MDKEEMHRLIAERDIWIYLVGRWQKDFEYVFPEMKITGYIDDRITKGEWQGKKLYCIAGFKEKVKADKALVVCCCIKDRHAAKEEVLHEFDGYDYVYAEDLFFLLDDDIEALIGGRVLAIWGTGSIAEKNWEALASRYKIDCFIDSDESKKEFHGYEVRHPADKWTFGNCFVVVANNYYQDISAQLIKQGLQEGKDFCSYRKLRITSYLLYKTWTSEKCYDFECNTMLHHLDILDGGDLNCCCATFMLELLGNLLEEDIQDIWNSKVHRILCVSLLNKTYCFCKASLCPALVGKDRGEYIEEFSECSYPEIESHPSSVNICIDHSCNLYCESCRENIQMADEKQLATAYKVADKVEKDILPYVNFIMMAGNGEVFLSKVYKKLWMSKAGKKSRYFQILSNGTLFTKAMWQMFEAGRESSVLLCVSIDAATEETYRKIRRGGSWNNLMKNMKFAGTLRANGKINYFRLNFVVQRENYKEIPQFIQMAKMFNADRVLLTRILNWGTYSNEEFKKITMVDKNGRPKPELQEVLNKPICKDEIVDIGTFNWDHVYEESKKVGSYYLWEIDNYSDLEIEKNVLGN